MRWFHATVAASSMAVMLTLASAQEARAGQVFVLQGLTVEANTTDPGLLIETAPIVSPLPGYSFTLDDVGDSHTFDLFRIWTDETAINFDDLIGQPIEVSLVFDPPAGGDPTVPGETVGEGTPVYLPFLGIFLGFVDESGRVQWPDPVLVTASNGAQYTLALSDAVFNEGAIDLREGWRRGADVALTVTLAANPVPEPSTLALGSLGLAIVGLGAYRRRRRAAAAAA